MAAFCLKLLLDEGVPFPELKNRGWQDGIGPLTFQEMEEHPFSQGEKNAILRHLELSL